MATEHHTDTDRAAWEARMLVLSRGIIEKHMANEYAAAAEARKLEWDEDQPALASVTPIRPAAESSHAYALRRAREILQTVEHQHAQLRAVLGLLHEHVGNAPHDIETTRHVVSVAHQLTADTAALDALRDMIQP